MPNFRSLLAAAAAKRITWVDDVALAREAGLIYINGGFELINLQPLLVELGDPLFCIAK